MQQSPSSRLQPPRPHESEPEQADATRQRSVVSKQIGRQIGDTMKTKLNCPCGELIRGDDEDDLVEKAFAHLRDKHPDMADEYQREHILFMAY
jgi:predicted small metal-binding protein